MGLSVLLWNFVQKIGPNVTKYTKMTKIFQGVYFNLLYMRQQVNTFVLISRRAFKYFATLAMRSSEFSSSNFLFPLLLGSGTSCPRITMFFVSKEVGLLLNVVVLWTWKSYAHDVNLETFVHFWTITPIGIYHIEFPILWRVSSLYQEWYINPYMYWRIPSNWPGLVQERIQK